MQLFMYQVYQLFVRPIQVPFVQSSTYQWYTVRITLIVLIIVLKRMLPIANSHNSYEGTLSI